jgi:nicotinamide mononucleotide transporter
VQSKNLKARPNTTMEIFNKILPFAFMEDAVQWLAFGFNLMYIILAGRGNVWCWVWGFFGTIFQFIVCLDADLKSDCVLQVYYLFSAIYGWVSWQAKSTETNFSLKTLPLSNHLFIAVLGIAIALPLGYWWHSAAFRYVDALLTAFSILTTFLTAKKYKESWLYWIAIDLSYALIYLDRDKYLLALLSIIYFLFSVKGYFTWQKMSTIHADKVLH